MGKAKYLRYAFIENCFARIIISLDCFECSLRSTKDLHPNVLQNPVKQVIDFSFRKNSQTGIAKMVFK